MDIITLSQLGEGKTLYPYPEAQATTARTKLGLSWDQVGTKFKLDPEELQILAFCQEAKTITELMNFMGWKHRTKFREKHINPLINNGLLDMTIPEKPRSSKQKYRISGLTLKMLS